MTLKNILYEIHARQPLYHFTYSNILVEILQSNKLISPISTTRNYNFSNEWEHFGDTRLTLNWDKIIHNYKVEPYTDFLYKDVDANDPYRGYEREEEINKDIKNLDKYLLQVDIRVDFEPVYEEIQDNYDDIDLIYSESSKLREEYILKAKKITNVPINIVNKWKPYN